MPDKTPEQIAEQRMFTDGRIVVTGSRVRRRPGKRADYILRHRADMPLGVVEAKPGHRLPKQRRTVAYLDDLQAKLDRLKGLQAQAAAELDALLPAILDKAFKGEL